MGYGTRAVETGRRNVYSAPPYFATLFKGEEELDWQRTTLKAQGRLHQRVYDWYVPFTLAARRPLTVAPDYVGPDLGGHLSS